MRLGALIAVVLLGACGDNLRTLEPDAAVPSGPDAEMLGTLLGNACPTASVPAIWYACDDEQGHSVGACIAEPDGQNRCRPWCRDHDGVYCAQIGGVVSYGPGQPCVCVPR